MIVPDRLFEADSYTAKGRKAHDERTARKLNKEYAVEVIVSKRWCLSVLSTPGLVHACADVGAGPDQHGAQRTLCGVKAGRLTYDIGQVVSGCRKCMAKIGEAR